MNAIPLGIHGNIWKRRLALAGIGMVLILLSKGLFIWSCWRHEPTGTESHYDPAYLGVLRPEATSSTLPGIRAIPQANRREALLFVREEAGRDLYPVYRNPDPNSSLHDRWEPFTEKNVIPSRLLNFDPETVLAAYRQTSPEHLFFHGFADGLRVTPWRTRHDGTFIELRMSNDNAMGPYTGKLTIYAQRHGQLSVAYASRRRLIDAVLLSRDDPPAMLVQYADGLASYRWREGRFVADPAVKREHWREVIGLCLRGSVVVNFCTVPYLSFLVIPMWLYRFCKWLFLRLTGRPYRKSRVARVSVLGCLVPLVFFLSLPGILMFSGHYFGPLAKLALIDAAGWVFLGMGAVMANHIDITPTRGAAGAVEQAD